MTTPSPLDIENAARRQEIADRFRSQFLEALALAEQALGPGWEPTGRHCLVDKLEEDRARKAGERPVPAATVITAEKDGVKRHFRADGVPTECASVEAGFGRMMTEPHPTLRLDWNGKELIPHRYSLHWGWFEPDYRPKSAEQLAASRAKREERAVEREAEAAPLFADLICEEGYIAKQKTRKI